MDKEKEKKADKMERRTKSKYEKYRKKADRYFEDRESALSLFNRASKKADKNKNALDEAWKGIQQLLGMLKDWVKGSYRQIPLKSLISIVAGAHIGSGLVTTTTGSGATATFTGAIA